MFARKSADFQYSGEDPGQRSVVIVIGSMEIHPYVGRVRLSGMWLSLSTKEYCVLLYLAQHAGYAVSPSELLHQVWGCTDVEGGTIHQVKSCIKRLRRQIELDSRHPRYVLTVYGCGYLMPTHIT